MSYTSLREDILMALYQEQSDNGINEIKVFSSLAEEYELEYNSGWLIEIQNDLRSEGLISGPSNGSNDDMAARKLTGQGLAYVEEKYGSEGTVPTLLVRADQADLLIGIEPDPKRITLSASPPSAGTHPIYTTVEGNDISLSSQLYESTAWTGKQFLLISSEVIDRIKLNAEVLRQQVYELHIPSNSESANIKALADALCAICSMAEPEISIIDHILASPKFKTYTSLAGVVATIRGAIGF